MSADRSPTHLRRNYWRKTLHPVHSLVLVAPLLLFFHLLTAYYGTNLLAPHLVGRFLNYFGATEAFLPALLICLVLVLQQAGRRDPWRIEPVVLAGMVGESIFWTIPLIGINELTGRLSPASNVTTAPAGESLLHEATTAVGAGVYEEFVFRLVLISLIVLFFSDALGLKKNFTLAAGIIAAAIIFALCHFSWDQITGAEAIKWNRLIFLAVAGCLWGGLYVTRGFAVAVGSHVLWDLYALWS